MPLPIPKPNEKYKAFVKRFLTDKQVKKEYPENKKRFAIMAKTWGKK